MNKIALRSITALFFILNAHINLAQDMAQDNMANMDSSAVSSISLNVFVRQNQVPQNRFAELVIQLQWTGDLDRYEVFPFENPILQNFEIQGSGSTNRVANVNGSTIAIREYTFTLKPEAIGMGYVESFIIKYTDLSTDVEHRLTTNRIPIQVIDPIPEPTSKTWVIVPIAILIFLAGAVYIIQRIRRNKAEREKKAQENAENAVPIEEKYLQQLKETVNLNEPTLDISKAFSNISRLLRRFLHERFDAPGLEATTTQVMDYLYEFKFKDRTVTDIKEILANADIIKFSGKPVDRPQLERAFTITESILQKSLRNEVGPHTND